MVGETGEPVEHDHKDCDYISILVHKFPSMSSAGVKTMIKKL